MPQLTLNEKEVAILAERLDDDIIDIIKIDEHNPALAAIIRKIAEANGDIFEEEEDEE